MSKKNLRKAYQKELAVALRTKRVRQERRQEEDFGFVEQADRNQWSHYAG